MIGTDSARTVFRTATAPGITGMATNVLGTDVTDTTANNLMTMGEMMKEIKADRFIPKAVIIPGIKIMTTEGMSDNNAVSPCLPRGNMTTIFHLLEEGVVTGQVDVTKNISQE